MDSLENTVAIWSCPDYPEFERIRDRLNVGAMLKSSPTSDLYHYTGSQGLLGIVESRRMRFTDASFMNDSTELKYATSLIGQALEEKATETPELRDFFEHLATRLNPADSGFGVYLACFTETPDLLSQWRAYGSFCLGFSTENKIRVEHHPQLTTRWGPGILRKVEYDEQLERDLVTRVISEVQTGFVSHLANTSESRRKVIFDFGTFFSNAVTEFVLAFKNPAFSEENEWRLIHYSLRHRQGQLGSIDFRVRNDTIVPYTDIALRSIDDEHQQQTADFGSLVDKDGYLPLKSIDIGPRPQLALDTQAIQLLMLKHGYSSVRVKCSNVPLRGGW